MGTVYRAQRAGDPRPRAVKVSRSVDDARAAVLEVQAAARLSHPHIVGVEAWGEVDGRFWVAMPLITGEALTTCLFKLSLEARWAVFDQLLDAIGYAHDRGVVHRDLKPDNVIVALDDPARPHAWLMDFGIAALAPPMNVGAVAATDGRSGRAPGTPLYMAPEQVRGGEIGPEADLYALGVMLFIALSGHVPFTGSGMGLLMAKLQQDAPPLSSSGAQRVSPELAAVVARLLARHPLDRFPSAALVRQALRRAREAQQSPSPEAAVGDEVGLAMTLEAGSGTEISVGQPIDGPTVITSRQPLSLEAFVMDTLRAAELVEKSRTAQALVATVDREVNASSLVEAWQRRHPAAKHWCVMPPTDEAFDRALLPNAHDPFGRAVEAWRARQEQGPLSSEMEAFNATPLAPAVARVAAASRSIEHAVVPLPSAPLDRRAILTELLIFLARTGPVLWAVEIPDHEASDEATALADFFESAPTRIGEVPVLLVGLRRGVRAPSIEPPRPALEAPDHEALGALLGPSLLQALHIAAFLGPSIPYALLERAGVLAEEVERLCTLGILRREEQPCSNLPPALRFAGERGRRELAASAPLALARGASRVAAEWLEERETTLSASERERLARHWTAAGFEHRAIGWLYRAGRRAELEGALACADRLYRHVIEARPDKHAHPTDLPAVYLALARVAYERGDMPEAERFATVASATVDRKLIAADAHRLLAEVHRSAGANALALAHVEAGLALLEPDGDRILRALLLGRRGWLTGYVMGRHAPGRADVQRAFSLLDGLDVPAVGAQMCSHLGAIELRAGDWNAQMAANELGLRMSEGAGDVAGRIRAHINLGACHHNRGRFAAALQHTQAAARLAELAGASTRRVIALNNLGLINLDLDALDTATEVLEACVALSRGCEITHVLFETYGTLARVALRQGRIDAAAALAQQTQAWAETTGSPIALAHAARILALVAWSTGQKDLAEDRLTRAIRLTETGDAYETALSALALAHLRGDSTIEIEARLAEFGADAQLERARWVTSTSASRRPSSPGR